MAFQFTLEGTRFFSNSVASSICEYLSLLQHFIGFFESFDFFGFLVIFVVGVSFGVFFFLSIFSVLRLSCGSFRLCGYDSSLLWRCR